MGEGKVHGVRILQAHVTGATAIAVTPQKRETLPDFGIWLLYSPFFHIQRRRRRGCISKATRISHLISTRNEYFQNISRMATVMHIHLWKAAPKFPFVKGS
jgi:hypothetical protein